MKRRLTDSTVIFGVSSLIACGLTLLNCSRTPKFQDANKPAPAPTTQNTPTATNANQATANNANANSNGTASLPAPKPAPANLVGSWTSECISPDTYSSTMTKLTPSKNIRINLVIASDGTYQKSASTFADTDSACTNATATIAQDKGDVFAGPTLTTSVMKNGTTLQFMSQQGSSEFTVYAIDPNLELTAPILTNPYTGTDGTKTISFTKSN